MINRPTIDSAPATSAGRPDTAVPKATSCWPVSQHQQLRPRSLQHGVDGGVARPRQLAQGRAWSRADTVNDSTPRWPSSSRPGGPTRVGVSKPANTSRHAAWAAIQIPIGQPGDKPAIRPGRGQPLPVDSRRRSPAAGSASTSRPARCGDWSAPTGAGLRRYGSTPPGRPAGRPGRRPRHVRPRTPAQPAHRDRHRRGLSPSRSI